MTFDVFKLMFTNRVKYKAVKIFIKAQKATGIWNKIAYIEYNGIVIKNKLKRKTL